MAEMQTPAALVARSRALFTEGSWFRRTLQINRPRICPFHELIEAVPQGARILDVGCGSGLFLGLLADAGRIAGGTGFDASPEAIDLAARMQRRHPRGEILDFACRSIADAWPESFFDVVSLIDLAHHVPPQAQRTLVEKAAQCVRPGGILLYKDVSASPHPLAWASVAHDLVFARQMIHIPRYSDVRAWAENAGLIEERHSRTVMFWYGHETGIFRRPTAS